MRGSETRPMSVSAVQFKATKGDKDASLRRLCELAGQAGAHADLVVLPEMAATGYTFSSESDVAGVAEEALGQTFQSLSEVAKAHQCWVVVGFPEKAEGKYYNSALVIDNLGAHRFTYRKTMLYEADRIWATPGDSGYAYFDTEFGRFSLGICMDLNDDNFVHWCQQAKLRVLAFPTNWVNEGASVWSYWFHRMGDMPTTLVAANGYGMDGDVELTGCSAILAEGEVLTQAPKWGDAVIHALLG